MNTLNQRITMRNPAKGLGPVLLLSAALALPAAAAAQPSRYGYGSPYSGRGSTRSIDGFVTFRGGSCPTIRDHRSGQTIPVRQYARAAAGRPRRPRRTPDERQLLWPGAGAAGAGDPDHLDGRRSPRGLLRRPPRRQLRALHPPQPRPWRLVLRPLHVPPPGPGSADGGRYDAPTPPYDRARPDGAPYDDRGQYQGQPDDRGSPDRGQYDRQPSRTIPMTMSRSSRTTTATLRTIPMTIARRASGPQRRQPPGGHRRRHVRVRQHLPVAARHGRQVLRPGR